MGFRRAWVLRGLRVQNSGFQLLDHPFSVRLHVRVRSTVISEAVYWDTGFEA